MTDETKDVAADAAETVAPNSVERSEERDDETERNNDDEDKMTSFLTRLDAIASRMETAVTQPAVDTAPTDKPSSVEAPGDGETIPDSSPVKPPWTHRGFMR